MVLYHGVLTLSVFGCLYDTVLYVIPVFWDVARAVTVWLFVNRFVNVGTVPGREGGLSCGLTGLDWTDSMRGG